LVSVRIVFNAEARRLSGLCQAVEAV